MTALPSSRVRGKVSDEWPNRIMDNRRKVPTATVTGNNRSREMHPNVRYANSNHYPQDCVSEYEIKVPGEKTSEETVSKIEETSVHKNNYHNYPDDSVYVNVVPRHSNNAALHEKHQRLNYSELNMPDAVVALQKLQKLKELQMKRDISERYYSQEIKRLIGEYYFGPRYTNPTIRPNRKLQSSSFQPSGDRLRNSSRVFENNLEPCGTMTTITKLNCGCIQETTRPIFTTARGRVQRKNCSQSQEEMFWKLTSSNPQEHLFSSLEQRKDRHCVTPKKRYSLDPHMCPKIPPAGDQGFETENEKRNDVPEPEIEGRVPRNPSLHRKFSDTSATSI